MCNSTFFYSGVRLRCAIEPHRHRHEHLAVINGQPHRWIDRDAGAR